MIAQAGGTNASFLISLVLMVGIFYFLLVRPQQRRMRMQRQLIASLEVGDEVLTIGGLFGTVRAIDDDAVTVELGPGTTVRLLKSAVARRLTEEPAAEPDEESTGTP